MPQVIDFYSTTVTPKQKKSLMAMYKDYLYFARSMERAAQSSSVANMATWQLLQMYGSEKIEFPWKIEYADRYEAQRYEDFVRQKTQDKSHYAYMSLNYTDLSKEAKLPKLIYVPRGYDMSSIDMELPSPVERYTAAFPEGLTLGEAVFLIDGRFRATYKSPKNAQMQIKNVLTDNKMHTEFRILMSMVKHCDENPYLEEKVYFRQMLNIIASEALWPYENMLLEALASFADKGQETCKSIFGGRSKDNYMKLAEVNLVVPSAAVFQEYLDIRHLLRHQLDTLDSLGKFNPQEAQKNKSLRERYLASYRKLCDQPVMGRIKNYVAVMEHMRPLIKALYPNYMVRENSESNTHFVTRLKNFIKDNPNEEILIETNYPLLSDKRKALMRNIAKVMPNVKIIDNLDISDSKFAELEKDYHKRGYFLRQYSLLECQMMGYCLANGVNCSNNEAWDFLKRRKLINYDEYENIWKPLRQLRNDLSHNHFDAELRTRLNEVCQQFIDETNKLNQRIMEQMPQIRHVDEGIYESVQANGRRVKIDFGTQQIEKKNPVTKPNNSAQKTLMQKKVHTEEFANGLGISMAGTEIVACRLPNELTINLRQQRIIYPDATAFYLNGNQFNVLQTEKCKIFTGKDFKISKYLDRGERRRVKPNDNYLLDEHYKIATDQYGRIKRIEFKQATSPRIVMNFVMQAGKTQINFSDGTELEINSGKFKIKHSGIELNFAQRKQFADSYTAGGIVPPSNNRNGR